MPSNHLETALWLESDRIGFLLPGIGQENLELQQNVVMNERRQVYDDRPYGLARMEMFNALFPAPHPFHNMVIGSMEDIAAATMDDVNAFFDTWYAPANITLTIAGDFDREEAVALVEKYFATLPERERPKRPRIEPPRIEETIVIHHEEPVASLPMVMVSWHSPAAFEPGSAEARFLGNILTTGRSSRLQRRLVHERQIAQSVSAGQSSNGHQAVFTVRAVARPGVTTDELLHEIDTVLDEIREEGPGEAEVARVLNRIETWQLSALQRLGGFGGRADQLQYYNHHVGDPDYLARDIARYRAVTAESVRDYSRGVLDPGRRVILHAVPPADAEAAPAASW